jgi:diadenylate cyclase
MAEFLQHSSWLLDLLDIGLLSFIIYRLVILIKGALAVRILLWFAIIALFYFGSGIIGLPTINALFSNFIAYAVVILVVIFQHDIRRALAASARKSIDKDTGREETHEILEEMITAAEALAGKNIGALIVFERDMPLDNYTVVGTEIDAKVTSELITSIFLPYSPIHDGAVIIQKGKLTKAGCFLPLTQNPEVSKAYGTRHRAAIGLTEVVDAIVIVVSEESGDIAVVVGGRITKIMDTAQLRKTLRKLLEPRWLQ